jgi:hypothetical protein
MTKFETSKILLKQKGDCSVKVYIRCAEDHCPFNIPSYDTGYLCSKNCNYKKILSRIIKLELLNKV